MPPIKVKAYGLILFTKRQYIITQLIVLLIIVALFVVSSIYDLDKFAFGNAKAVISLATLLEFIETFFMLKKFREKESYKL